MIVGERGFRAVVSQRGGWTFLTNHAAVFLCIARNPSIRMREIAHSVGITERAAQRIVANLVEEGYVHARRQGRRNAYEVDLTRPFRHSMFDGTIDVLISALEKVGSAEWRD